MLRSFLLVSHRWMGLTSSLVLAIAGLTGAVLVWPLQLPGRGPVTQMHESLALGPLGRWTVLIVTAIAILLQIGGLYLWLQRMIFSLRRHTSWRRWIFDLHHVVGIFGLVVMLTLAVTGVGRVVMRRVDPAPAGEFGSLRRAVIRFHAGQTFHPIVKLLWALGSAGFAVQGATGVLMWWRSGNGGSQSVPSSRARN